MNNRSFISYLFFDLSTIHIIMNTKKPQIFQYLINNLKSV